MDQTRSLIVQTAFVGDLLLGIPLYRRLRSLRPQEHWVLLCRKGLGDFMLKSGLVDSVVEVDKTAGPEGWSEARKRLRAENFDLIICPHQSFRSAWLVRGLKAREKLGYFRWWNSFAFPDRVERPMHLPEALRQLALIHDRDSVSRQAIENFTAALSREKPLEARAILPSSLLNVPEFVGMGLEAFNEIRMEWQIQETLATRVSPKVRVLVAELGLTANRPLAILSPGSVWPTKMWTQSGYAGAARGLLQDGFQVLFAGAASEAAICERIRAEVPGAHSVAGRTDLWESGELMSLADIALCNDSGAMHLAAAAGVPTVSVFGPTTLDLGYRPWQNHARVVQIELPCRPCGKHGAKKCPIGTHECMTGVTPAQVLKEVRALIPLNTPAR